ncbi:MAG: flagellar biosynthesis protein FliQ [Candidatus Nucleicultricaceae bacterium]
MSPADVIDISREAIVVILKIGAPIMLVALAVGLVISFFQALTQIQEMTISFIPKMIATFGVIFFLVPYMSHVMTRYAHDVFNLIAHQNG